MSEIVTTDWVGCYDETWHGEIVKSAFAHPAKFSRNLIQFIYRHAVIDGWVKRGDTVLDPFGGVALGALDATLKGLNWFGCELEDQWARIGNENILKWQKRYGGFAKGKAVLIKGNSLNLSHLLGRGELAMSVSSPPYINSLHGGQDGIDWEKAKQNGKDGGGHHKGASCHAVVGKSEGQLAGMPEGAFELAVSSPPFIQTPGGAKGINVTGYGPEGKDKVGERTYQARGAERDASNLETLKEGDFDLAVSSPPYETIATGAGGLNTKPAKKAGQQSGRKPTAASQNTDQRYGRGVGQLAIGTGETFWQSSRQIIEQVFLLLRPGGHAVFVCKDFVREKQRVPFSDNWQKLCEVVGFKCCCRHRAMQVESLGTNLLLEGGEHTKKREKKSFFRRNAEKHGSPKIDWEDVICLVKPACASGQEAGKGQKIIAGDARTSETG